MNTPANRANKRLVWHVRLRYFTTRVISAYEFEVRSVLHGQMSLAAVNQIYVFHDKPM